MEAFSLRMHRAVVLAAGAAAGRHVGLRQQRRTDARDPDHKQQTGKRATHKHEGLYYITEACDVVCLGNCNRPFGVATDWQLQ
ncbi:MAG TPA: hypothetical protein VMD98_09315 [Bryocella sp.]|nr:hypothetical protein [Bryocella sp.]